MIEEESDKFDIPGLEYLVALIAGLIFLGGGITQLVLIASKSGFNGDYILGIIFMVSGIIGTAFGLVNILVLRVKRKREEQELLKEKYGYSKH